METNFEQIAKALGLSPEDYIDSVPLRGALANKDERYVPPELLEAWGFVVDDPNAA